MIVIGRFRETHGEDGLPSIFAAIRNSEPREKEKVLSYLKNAAVVAVSPGVLHDVIDKSNLVRNLVCHSDGTYLWRSDVIYYYDKYNIELPSEFISHVLIMQDKAK